MVFGWFPWFFKVVSWFIILLLVNVPEMQKMSSRNTISSKKGEMIYSIDSNQVIGDTARISGTGQITAIVSDYSCPSISAGG